MGTSKYFHNNSKFININFIAMANKGLIFFVLFTFLEQVNTVETINSAVCI